MARIIDTNGKEVSEAAAMKTYFGLAPEQTLSGFMAEVKALTPEAKTELALGAAKNLGYTITE